MINSRKVLSRQFNIGVDVSFFELWPWLHPQKAYLSPTTHTEPLQLIEINYRILLPKKTQASQDMVCSRNLDSLINLKLRKLNLSSFLFQRKRANIFYPESGFEARYERVNSF